MEEETKEGGGGGEGGRGNGRGKGRREGFGSLPCSRRGEEVTCMRGSKKACAGVGSGAPSRAAATLGNSLRRLARPGGRCSGGAGTRGASGLSRLFVLACSSRSRGPSVSILSLSGSSLESCTRRTVSAASEWWDCCAGGEGDKTRDASVSSGVCGAREDA